MINKCFAQWVLCTLCAFISFQGFSQLSKKHYIPPLTSSEFGNANPEDQYIYISTPSTALVPYTIIPVGQPAANYINGTVSNNTPQVISIGFGNGQLFVASPQTSQVTNNKGYIIEAEAPVYVSVRMNAGGGAQAGALVSKGASALGNVFRIGTYTNENPQDNYLSFVSVMATEDNTQVTFDNLPAGLVIKNYFGATPIPINLNEGESYIVATNSFEQTVANRDGLIGCLVTSNKPIVVNCGSANGSFHNGGGRDYGIDQIAGLSKVGKEYIFVRGGGSDNWENILIVAHSDNTTISINGGTPVATINAGQYYLIEGNNYSTNGNMYVATSQDVFAYQGVGGGGEANQGMFFVPPLSCETRGNIDNIADIDNIGNTTYSGGVSIVTKTGANVTINNLPLSNFSTTGPSVVTGKSDYITYQVTGLGGNVSVQGDNELYVAYFNINGAATSGSFYSGFPSNPEINFDAQFATLGNCIPNITLEAANAQNFDTYEWFFDDGSGFQSVPSSLNVTSITPTIPARYKLIGTIACTGETLQSVEVPVSICPDDIDNDGIIDNLDIDNDNDGILNCTESLGDVTFNLINPVSPQLIFQDNSINNAIASGNYSMSNSSTNSNTFTGSNLGNFTSNALAGAISEGNYDLTFTESVNVKLSEDITYSHSSVDGEYFIVRILPSNKNITLVDSDDRLLVDSNFDGLFETGVTQISGSEIHFKINPTPTGTTPFEFYANQVDGFSFMHKLSNLTESSTFQGIVSLTCFKKDNDGDGIKDELDLDSDNDGIPDFIEQAGTIVSLSNTDADANGLDDIFDINGSPIDTDNDGVWDFYDLDSDNDGIFDLIEANPSFSHLLDSDINGIEDGPVYGTNGWTDNAETVPDSNTLDYTLNDLDADGIFSYIDLDSDGDLCSDVIEAGFSDGNEDNYLGDNTPTVDTNGLVTNASDGYIIPNSDYLTSAPITITAQPIDLEVCETTDNNISLESSTFDTIQWEVSTDGVNWITVIDDTTYSNSNSASLLVTNTPLSINTNFYRAFLNRNGNSCGLYSEPMQLTVIELPIANPASNLLLCDDDNNGTVPFDLTPQDEHINSTPGMTISYHLSQNDADLGISPVTSPLESANTTIYARVENDANSNCYATTSFDLEVYESPFPQLAVTSIEECDDTSVGTDTDGLKVFDLTQRETEILNGQSASDFTLTYFTDAGYMNPIGIPNAFSNSVTGNQTIYVRMTNNAFTDCYADTSFEVTVFELPTVNTPSIYAQCDDDTNDGQAFFNLTLDYIKEEINTNYAAENLTFTYFETQIDAENNTNTIPTPEAYQDALGFMPETIWIRVENPNGCYRVTSLTLEVNPSSGALSAYNPTSFYQCDDGTDNRDGISTFDMTSIKDYIENTIFSSINASAHFYESLLDAELETNEILDVSNHQNTSSPNSQSIWVRVKSDLGNDCLGLEEFPNLLIVEALPVANLVTMNRQCDYDTTDAVFSYPFDTSQLEAMILGTQNPSDVSITYFDSNANPLLYSDGSQVTSPIQPTFLSENQVITVRVTNNNTNDPDGPCYDETTIEFIIDEQPIIADPVEPQIFCDDGNDETLENDGLHAFDTSTFTSIIKGTQANMDIYYSYLDENGTQVSNAASLPNPLVSGNQIIDVEVVNPINLSCSAFTTIELMVNPVPEFSINEEEIVCTSDPTFFVTLDPVLANSNEVFNYEWTFGGNVISNDKSITISAPGNYSITLINPVTLCTKTKVIEVKASELANISSSDLTIVDLSENNSVTINNPTGLGSGTYQFSLESLDGDIFFPYQDHNVFNNVRAGIYTLFVKDDICGIVELEVYVVGHRKFFTPNGDGRNDYWQIQGLSSIQAGSQILIFDRYGKLIKQLDPFSQGWDGTFNGSLLPTDDYWFRVLLGDGRSFMGHFSLKR